MPVKLLPQTFEQFYGRAIKIAYQIVSLFYYNNNNNKNKTKITI